MQGTPSSQNKLEKLAKNSYKSIKKKKKDWHPNRKMGRSFDQVLQKKNIQMTIKQGKKGYYG